MSKLRWGKLWWADYENDPALRLCSLAAQGLWMRLLCLAASSRVYGHVLVAGQPPTIAEIARIVGARPDQVKRLLVELESHQVFARLSLDSRVTVESLSLESPEYVIVSRRMVNDFAEHNRKVSAGEQGGNPILKGQTETDPSPNGHDLDKQPLNQEERVEESLSKKINKKDPPRSPPVNGGEARARGLRKLVGKEREARCGFVPAGQAIRDEYLAGADDDARPVPLQVIKGGRQ